MAGACDNCGMELAPGDRFCAGCATPVPESDDAETAEQPRAHTASLSLSKPPKAPAPAVGPSADGTAGPGTAAPGTLKKRLILAAAAAAALVILIVAGVSIGAAVRTGQTAALDDSSVIDPVAEEPVSETDGPSPDANSSEAPVATPTLYFQSVSGNIRCELAPAGVLCQQGSINYPKPSAACAGGPSGVVIEVTADGVTWPCAPADIRTSTALPYDQTISAYGFACIINFDRGITCKNESGKGFTMEYDAGVSTF